ncbi:beta-ketoacyl-[acyl-carrier-protein] synthase family protein [Amycolatopsis rhabdoformis]|uniref:Beta-ketoacyl-[acyl-carrier-protein] synthase family protein n=1 Tax=Amycolatopsis rhabdoformis TaxID=1448059 RepID=A0ABZ1HWF3_9PSEU|nr:beta-ketoacyl-[acyl-carrier-protein] synthase family protein [Amycolatopsis rhabdoformis]WSE26199.1 beta-ketoacyl-[acyl-carrier-protein] synthase family protein [Amycolatopsis rhabdoformis]
MKPALNRRVAVTGIGVVSPAGIGVKAFWAGLARPAGPASVRRLDGFAPRRWMSHKVARTADIATQMAVAAADEALADAGLLTGEIEPTVSVRDADRAAVSLGTGIGGVSTLESQAEVLAAHGVRKVSPHVVPMTMPNAGAAALSIRYGFRGSASVITTACAAGTDAIAAGARLIASGAADLVLAGGSDSSLTPVCVAGFTNMRALSRSGISRPFDVDRDGLAASEAAGILVLEPLEQALDRGASIYLTIDGAASTADAHHVTAPAPDGAGAERCMRLAIEDAGYAPADITHVNAHGTSTALNDAAEAHALRRVFGAARPLVTSIKGATGHSFGSAGAVEAVAVALTMAHELIPPTLGLSTQDPALDLDVARELTPWTPGPVLSNSFGFGGHNGSLVFSPLA